VSAVDSSGFGGAVATLTGFGTRGMRNPTLSRPVPDLPEGPVGTLVF